MSRLLGVVSSCKECPHRHYYSAGQYECLKYGTVLPLEKWGIAIPEWCPLPPNPAPAFEAMRRELQLANKMYAEEGHKNMVLLEEMSKLKASLGDAYATGYGDGLAHYPSREHMFRAPGAQPCAGTAASK